MSFDVVYVSPHSDDVAFSAAAQVAQDVASGSKVALLTVFEPPPSSASDVFGGQATRSAEDQAFADLVGVERVSAGFKDAVIRRPRYRNPHNLLVPLPNDEEPLVDAVRARIESFVREGCRRIVAPLGVGEHIDHQIAHAAARTIEGAEISFYEDTPYMLTAFQLARRLSRLGLQPTSGNGPAVGGGPVTGAKADLTLVRGSLWRELAALATAWRLTPLLDASLGVRPGMRRPWWLGIARSLAIAYMLLPYLVWSPRRGQGTRAAVASIVRGPGVAETKMAAVAAYASQWPAFVPSLDVWRAILQLYALQLGENDIVERVWRMQPG